MTNLDYFRCADDTGVMARRLEYNDEWPRLSNLILLTYALVPTSDWIEERLRLRVA
jgi:hypothetical protein